MKVVTLFLILLSTKALAQTRSVDFGTSTANKVKCESMCEEKKAIRTILQALMPASSSDPTYGINKQIKGFSTRGCEPIPVSAWTKLVLLNRPILHPLHYKAGCDVQGTIRVDRTSIPIDLLIRNLGDYNRVVAKVSQEFDLLTSGTPAVAIDIKAKDGKLKIKNSTDDLEFSADYNVVVGMTGGVLANNGGTIFITKYEGKPVQVREPIFIDP